MGIILLDVNLGHPDIYWATLIRRQSLKFVADCSASSNAIVFLVKSLFSTNLSKIKLVITSGEQVFVIDGVSVKNASEGLFSD